MVGLTTLYHPRRLAGRDLAQAARALARDRKVFRMLDAVAIPPFVAALEAWAEGRMVHADRTALLTVSACEPEVPYLPECDTADWEDRARAYCEQSRAGRMLQRMPNSVLCHIAIAGRFRGPNAHWVGDADTLAHVLGSASRTIERGDAEAALVVTFDRDRGATSAACVVLASCPGTPVPVGGQLMPSGQSATAALTAIVERAEAASAGAA